MSEPEALPRPRQVTVAGGAAIVTCVLLVVALFDAMARVRSAEMRTDIADLLARPPGNGLGIDVEQAVTILRGIVLFNGAVAAAATVLAIYTLQRHNGARIGLSVAAALLLFTAPVSGGVLPVLIAAAATMLWSAPARDWFAGRPARPAPEPRPREQAPSAAERSAAERSAWAPPVAAQRLDPPAGDDRPDGPDGPGGAGRPAGAGGPDSSAEPPPQPGPQQPGPVQPGPVEPGQGEPHAQPGPAAYPFGSGPAPQGFGYPTAPFGGAPAGPAADRRPTTVTVAAWITWVFSGFTAVTYVVVLLSLVTMRDEILRELHKNQEVARLDLSDRELVAGIWVVGVVVLLWALAAMVLAFLTYRRVGWARVALAVSAGITGLVAVTAYQAGLVHAVAAFTTIWLLFRPASNAWFRARTPGGPSYGGPTQPPGGSSHGDPGQTPGGPSYGGPQQPPTEPDRPKNVW